MAVTEAIGHHYKFSPRLLGMMCTEPPKAASQIRPERMRDKLRHRMLMRDDVEHGIPTSPISTTAYSEKVEKAENPLDPSHYRIAGQMINYSSTDITERCMSFSSSSMHDQQSWSNLISQSFVLVATGCMTFHLEQGIRNILSGLLIRDFGHG